MRGGRRQDDRTLDLILEPGEVGLGLGVEVDHRAPSEGPSVPGDQAFGNAIRGMHWGSITCMENRFSVQPRPNGPQGSRWASESPHAASLSRVHSLARFMFGEPVKRGPITSVR